jgi:CheY-like chemotaxis protein
MNCRVEEATSADEIINKLYASVDEGDPFKIALIDFYTLKSDVECLGQKIKTDLQLRDLHLIMLTSVGKRGDARYFQNLGFDAYLAKPIKQTQLQDCLRIVTGKHASFGEDTSNQIVTRYSITEGNKLRIRVHLAEDNIVNKKVALHVLEKKLGYHVDAVTNGKEALERLKRFDYDLVLMDCQMPEMDGYEATLSIRDNDSSVRNPGIPIIAITANAMKGDREKCLEVGMDDFITKPINVKELAEAIERNIVKKE